MEQLGRFMGEQLVKMEKLLDDIRSSTNPLLATYAPPTLTPALAVECMATRGLFPSGPEDDMFLAKPVPPFPTLAVHGNGEGVRKLVLMREFQKEILRWVPGRDRFIITVYKKNSVVCQCPACNKPFCAIDRYGRIFGVYENPETHTVDLIHKKEAVKPHTCSAFRVMGG